VRIFWFFFSHFQAVHPTSSLKLLEIFTGLNWGISKGLPLKCCRLRGLCAKSLYILSSIPLSFRAIAYFVYRFATSRASDWFSLTQTVVKSTIVVAGHPILPWASYFPLSWGLPELNLLRFPLFWPLLSYSNFLFLAQVSLFSLLVSSRTRAIFIAL